MQVDMNGKSATMFAWSGSLLHNTVLCTGLSSIPNGTGCPQTQARAQGGIFVFLNRISGSHPRRWRMTPGYWPGGLSAVKIGACNENPPTQRIHFDSHPVSCSPEQAHNASGKFNYLGAFEYCVSGGLAFDRHETVSLG